MTPNETPPAFTGGASVPAAAKLTGYSDSPTAQPITRATVELLTLASRESYVIRVAVTLTNGQTRTQHYASLHAAVRAEERARGRGCAAVLALARVVPVGIVTGDELDVLRGDQ